jgi:hypothetical protein
MVELRLEEERRLVGQLRRFLELKVRSSIRFAGAAKHRSLKARSSCTRLS